MLLLGIRKTPRPKRSDQKYPQYYAKQLYNFNCTHNWLWESRQWSSRQSGSGQRTAKEEQARWGQDLPQRRRRWRYPGRTLGNDQVRRDWDGVCLAESEFPCYGTNTGCREQVPEGRRVVPNRAGFRHLVAHIQVCSQSRFRILRNSRRESLRDRNCGSFRCRNGWRVIHCAFWDRSSKRGSRNGEQDILMDGAKKARDAIKTQCL